LTEVGKHYVRNPEFIFRKIVEEMVLVPIHQNIADMDCIYTLNEIGAFIWDKLSGEHTQVELEQFILDEYDVELQTAQHDIEIFIEEMVKIGAVKVTE